MCPSDKLTIGWGHVILPGEKFTRITEEKAAALLSNDLKVAERAVSAFVHVHLTDNEFSALVSFTFNAGVGNFKSSTLLKKLNDGKKQDVPEQMLRWVYGTHKGKKVKLAGLVRRRIAEGELFNLK